MVQHMEGHVRLALLAEALPGSVILDLLPPFRKQNPGIRFSVTFEGLASIEAGLVSDRVTFGLVDRSVANDFLASVDCGHLDYVAVASTNYVAQNGPLDDPEKVLVADLIDLGEHMPLARRWAGAADAQAGDLKAQTLLDQVKPAFVVPNFQAALAVLRQDAGVACLPRPLVADALARGEVKELAPTLPVPAAPLTLLYRLRNTRQLFESLFLEYLLDLRPLPTTRA